MPGLRAVLHAGSVAVMETMLLLCAAGMLASAMNAVAGGGSFVTLPALIAVGLSSVAANQSSTVALFIGTISSTWAVRHGIGRGIGGVGLRALLPVSILGGLLGAILLVFTPPIVLDHVLPWLLLLAALTLAFGRRIGGALRGRGVTIGAGPVLAVQFLLAIYGGYFGGAIGIMYVALWTLLGDVDLRALSPTRTLLVTATNATAVICFAILGAVAWGATVAVAVGAAFGGYGGAWVGQRVPHGLLRGVTLVITIAMTAVFFYRAY